MVARRIEEALASWRARALLPKLARLARDPVEGPVLEVGCGRGGATDALSRRWPRLDLVAVDPDPDAVLAARLRLSGRARIEQAEPTSLPFPAGRFGTVLVVDVLHEVAEYERALREAHRVLAPGGQLLLAARTEPWFRGPLGALARPSARFAKSALRTALVGAGFHVDVLTGDALVLGRAVKETAGARDGAD